MRWTRVMGAVAGLAMAWAALASPPGAAQSVSGLPGVGYDPQARGLTTSLFILDNLNNPYTRYPAVFTAHPGQAGTHPSEYFLDLSDPAVRAAFELRWGPETSSGRFKRWGGPNNEVRFMVQYALAYLYQKHPEMMGGSTAGRNGVPTETEITDAQAFMDTPIWTTYMQEALQGYAPSRRVTICDPAKPPGDGQTQDPFWNLTSYYRNVYQPQPPVSPQLPLGVLCAIENPSG